MGKIYCLIGKSGSGKDTAFNALMNKNIPDLERVVTYTTRPIRTGETDGVEYHFVDEAKLRELESTGDVIERRTYHTVHGDWNYFTCTIDISGKADHIIICTPDVIDKLYEKYDRSDIVVFYLEMDNGERLKRCIDRESRQKAPDYSEVCRRFLADEADFYKGRSEKYGNLHRIDASQNVGEVVKCIENLIDKYRV